MGKLLRPMLAPTVDKVLALRKTTPRVALLIQPSSGCGQGILRGVASYILEHQPWSIYVDQWGFNGPLSSWLATWDGQGIITQGQPKKVLQAIAKLRIPVIDVQFDSDAATSPSISVDDESIARLAASHLLERHFRRFAYVGFEGTAWSDVRGDAFAEALCHAGHACYRYTPSSESKALLDGQSEQADLEDWLKCLPHPIGVMAANDTKAICILEACRRANLAVPEHIAVVGVGNNETICNLTYPPLSSVRLDFEQIGIKAAEFLDRLMHSDSLPMAPVNFKPIGVELRRSTDLFAIDDALTAMALRFIHHNACRGISVADVARHCGIPRKNIERRFLLRLGVSPHRLIQMVKLSLAKTLLSETDFSLDEIARQCSLTHAPYLNVFFKKETGLTPGEYRRVSQSNRYQPQPCENEKLTSAG